MIIWLIGMSGAGKTTVGVELYQLIKKKHSNTLFLDGDEFRKIMGNDLGHSMEDRKKNADRFCRFCQYLDSHGINVVCAFLSLFPDSREWNRQNLKNYFEVFLDVPFDTLVKRDAKGIYAKALRGEIKDVVGVDIEYPRPKNSNLIMANDGSRKAIDVAQEIYSAVQPGLQ